MKPPINVPYVALLRGINVGSHHKVPMPELRKLLENHGFRNIKTLLNSGNVVFKGTQAEDKALGQEISQLVEQHFGFPVPILLRKGVDIQRILARKPFEKIETHKDLRLYVTFLNNMPKENSPIPWASEDGSFQIIGSSDTELYSTVDISKSKTTDAMKHLEKSYGKDITTRNWNTLEKIGNLLE